MRRFTLVVICLTAIACLAAPSTLLAAAVVGEPAPDFTLPDLAGEEHILSQYQGEIVVLEWINPNCPVSRRHAEEETMIALAAAADGVVWLAVNSTNPEHQDYLATAEHQAYNDEMGITYAVLYDASGDVGRDYDAKTTPHMYVIDAAGTLVYNGAIDDDPRGGMAAAARTGYVADALAALTAGGTPDPATTKPYGCSVKY